MSGDLRRVRRDPLGELVCGEITGGELNAKNLWLIAITRKAKAEWLRDTSAGEVKLDYANAMVPARQPSPGNAIANWQEHVDGKPQYAPPILPLAPARFTGSLYLAGGKVIPECSGETSPGMLGYMFWAAGCLGTRSVCTTPPNTCEGGVGVGATTFGVPIPMPPLTRY